MNFTTQPFLKIFIWNLSLIIIFLSSCTETEKKSSQPPVPIYQGVLQFEEILKQENSFGSILIFDPQKLTYYSNNFERANSNFLPASTFKIPNSLIALETRIVKDEKDTIRWEGMISGNPDWDRDLSLKEAFHYSCVPCYRNVARQIGVSRMNEYVSKFGYGNMEIDSNSLDLFWLQGNSRISQMEQINFLMKFYDKTLSISKRTDSIAKSMMIVEQRNDYKIIAKSGSTLDHLGWYVGYVEKSNKVYFFANNLEPIDVYNAETRKKVSLAALTFMQII